MFYGVTVDELVGDATGDVVGAMVSKTPFVEALEKASSAYILIACRYPSTPANGSVPLGATFGKDISLTLAP